MDLPLAAPDALVRPWRTAALIAGTLALVELLILLAIGGRALAGAVSHRVQRAAEHRAHATAKNTKPVVHARTHVTAVTLSRSRTSVLVLNGNGRQGAAATAASRVHAHGYRIRGVANAPRSDYGHSIVMYRARFAPEGRRLGRDLGISLVTPLDGMRARELHGAQVVLILGR